MELNNLFSLGWSSASTTQPVTQQQSFSQSITETLTETIVQKTTAASVGQDVVSSLMQPWQSASEQLFNSLTDNLIQSMIQTMLPVTASENDGNAVTETEFELQPFAQGSVPGFADMLDILNPLQHIPVVNHYYQQWSGDQIGYLPQVIGSTLYGGSLGLVTSAASIGLSGMLEQSPVQYISNSLFQVETESKKPL